MKKGKYLCIMLSFVFSSYLFITPTLAVPTNKLKLYSTVEFAKTYETPEELVANAEVIVYGITSNLQCFSERNAVFSKFTLKNPTILKGTIDKNNFNIISHGGVMLYEDYLVDNEKSLSEQKKIKRFQPNTQTKDMIVEYNFNNTKYIENGEKVLLFLTKSTEKKDIYYILGTCYYGKFQYNPKHDTFYRANHNVVYDLKNQEPIIELTVEELQLLIGSTEDKSEINKKNKLNRPNIMDKETKPIERIN